MDNKDIDVLCVGSCMIDLNAYTSQLPRANETFVGHYFMQTFGGKGANQIIQAARLGVRTVMIGSLGDDFYGSSYIDLCNDGCYSDVSLTSSSVDSNRSVTFAEIMVSEVRSVPRYERVSLGELFYNRLDMQRFKHEAKLERIHIQVI
jgi:sugar/nucleoside kinase (ribokinase family)